MNVTSSFIFFSSGILSLRMELSSPEVRDIFDNQASVSPPQQVQDAGKSQRLVQSCSITFGCDQLRLVWAKVSRSAN